MFIMQWVAEWEKEKKFVTWLISFMMCALTYFIQILTWLIHMHKNHVWHDSSQLSCVTWLISVIMCDLTHFIHLVTICMKWVKPHGWVMSSISHTNCMRVTHISYKLYACHAYLIQIVCGSRICHTNCMRVTHISYKLYACHAYLIQIVCVSRISHTNCDMMD